MADALIVNVRVLTGSAVFEDSAILIKNGVIADVFNMSRLFEKHISPEIPVFHGNGMTATAGLIDTHIHGIGGFETAQADAENILGMSEALAKYGVTGFLPTLYPDGEESINRQIDAVLAAMGHEKGARILGINIEGPFISPARLGALPAAAPVDVDYFERIIARGKGQIKAMTVAPELKGMRELALDARRLHVVLLAGHTDAKYENIIEGMQCGILHSTHFFNAMKGIHHRNPGAAGAILIHREMSCEIIADGVHVHPELVKLVIRNKDDDNIVLVTDSIRPTGFASGIANGHEVVLSEEGAFVAKEDHSLLHGSALTLNRAVSNLIKWGINEQLAVKMATENPASIYKFENMGSIIPGNLGDVVIFDSGFNPAAVFVGGRRINV